jgi:serine protease Do
MIRGTSHPTVAARRHAAGWIVLVAVLAVPATAPAFFGSDGDETPPAAAPKVTLPDFATLVEKLAPSVVNISTRQAPPRRREFQVPPGDDPLQEFFGPFDHFFGPRRRQQARSLGSGVIIDADGFIVTNNHVVADADEIVVKLSSGEEYKGDVVGRDDKTDIALVRIEGAKGLRPAPLGDSEGLRVGEWVLAIGNPFALDNTVTAGIISAIGRNINQGPYDNFIQTDAAINPGNSGGPLINTRGEVIGINTAIFSRGGGNIGIGFAIPINLAGEIVPQLKTKGRVTRGWLGVMIQRVTPEIADSLGYENAEGALVSEVMPDGPAAGSGLEQGDVIVEFDGSPVKESSDLPRLVARTPIGKRVSLKVMRGGDEHSFTVEIGELAESEPATPASTSDRLGLSVQTLTADVAENLGIPSDVQGVVVTSVDPEGPAAEGGLRRGDVVLEVNRRAVRNVRQYEKALKAGSKGTSVLLLVRRGDNTIFLALRPSE